jgi:hypothetical protein
MVQRVNETDLVENAKPKRKRPTLWAVAKRLAVGNRMP